MRLTERIYVTVHKMLPTKYKKRIEKLLLYADIRMEPAVWTGFTFLYSLAISLACVLLITIFVPFPIIGQILLFLIFFSTTIFIFYFLLSYTVVQRTKQIETTLPDALQLLAANIRAGMTPDRALFLSARPEFGILSDEIMKAGEETLAGKPITDSLTSLASRIDSNLLRKVIGLIVEGITAGGELASLLEKTAEDIRMADVLKKEIQANVGIYVVFMLLAILVAAPVLYATSVNFVGMSLEIRKTAGVPAFTAEVGASRILPITEVRQPLIDINMLQFFALINLSITSFFGALLVGVLKEGEEAEGVKLIPVLISVSIIAYLLSLNIISSFLKSVMVG